MRRKMKVQWKKIGDYNMPRSELIGYVRKSKNGQALKISLSVEAFNAAEKYASADGSEYVGLIVNTDRTSKVINGDREVTSVCQLVE